MPELSKEKKQLTDSAKNNLTKQHYRIIGSHSAVKPCGWTKNMIRGEGGCYKLKFYGIMSNQCLQMTTSISCANRCSFCWRGYKSPVAKEWTWKQDEPEFIVEESIKAHHDLLVGFKGSKSASKPVYEKSTQVKHVALSLTGEPIMYPKINEAIKEFNKKGISTFLVTNAQYPEQIRDLAPTTQLYISLDAPNKTLLKEIDLPLFDDYWERLNQSLEYLAKKQERTCIRLTLIKDLNMQDPEEYAKMIMKGNPDFIEAKAYMWIGASVNRLEKSNMPMHEEVVRFTKDLVKYLEAYEIVSEHIPSRVVMLAKKKFKVNNIWKTWIDFPKYDELVNAKKPFTTNDYLKKTPINLLGISGKGTVEHYKLRADKMGVSPEEQRKMFQELEKRAKVDENTEELTFHNNH
tara:strand:+ start:2559 stop:3773 length:1215 start_codon:yes stop_codon:yes gene_type:complete